MEQSKVFSHSVGVSKVNIVVTRKDIVALDVSKAPASVEWSMMFKVFSPLGCWLFEVKKVDDTNEWYKLMKADKHGFMIDKLNTYDNLAPRGWIEVRGDRIKFRRWYPGHNTTYKAPRELIMGALGWALNYITGRPHVCAGL
jgi:hypothetical protein